MSMPGKGFPLRDSFDMYGPPLPLGRTLLGSAGHEMRETRNDDRVLSALSAEADVLLLLTVACR